MDAEDFGEWLSRPEPSSVVAIFSWARSLAASALVRTIIIEKVVAKFCKSEVLY